MTRPSVEAMSCARAAYSHSPDCYLSRTYREMARDHRTAYTCVYFTNVDHLAPVIDRLLDSARAEERERCAKACRAAAEQYDIDDWTGMGDVARNLERAIRSIGAAAQGTEEERNQ